MTTPVPEARETADIETSSERYALRFAGPVGEFFLDVQRRHVLSLLAQWPGSRVLEVGGGHAQLAGPLVSEGFDVTVIGSDPVCEARLKAALPTGAYTFRHGNLLDLPFADRSFDVVMAVRLLPHVEQWQVLLREICRLARHAVIVDYPAVESVNVVADRLFAAKKAIEKDTRPYRCFERRELVEAFGKLGFGSAEFRPQFVFPMFIHRALGSVTLSKASERSARALGLTSRYGSPVVLRVVRQVG